MPASRFVLLIVAVLAAATLTVAVAAWAAPGLAGPALVVGPLAAALLARLALK